MGVEHALNSIALQVFAHGVGSYKDKDQKIHRIDKKMGNLNFSGPNQ
jgi:hypothetical protein